MIDSKVQEKISEIEKEIRETPYHKGTEHHIGLLRAKLAKLRESFYEGGGSGGGSRGFGVRKQGDATVAIIGPPSVGKSTILNTFANTNSPVGSYDFTTTQVIPGMMNLKGAKIQLFDLPGLIDEGSLGKGGGKRILSVARTTDLFLLVTDKDNFSQFQKIIKELGRAGFRLNQTPPKIEIKKTFRGSIKIIDPFRSFPDETVRKIVEEFGYKNAEVVFRESIKDLGLLIDALSKNRRYLPAIIVINKSEDLKEIDRKNITKAISNPVFISAHKGEGMQDLKERIWANLEFIRIYLKKHVKQKPEKDPLIISKGIGIKKMVEKINSDWTELVTGALVWGKKVKFPGQKVSLNYRLEDGDIVYLVKRF